MSFKIGDRVVATADHDGNNTKDQHGVVVNINGHIGVQFDVKLNRGHDCSEKGKSGKLGYCWWMPTSKLKLETPGSPWEIEEVPVPDLDAIKIDVKPPVTIVHKLCKPPKLTSIERSMVIVASSGYPYAIKDTDGKLYFYSERPNLPNVFETSAVLDS